jgi:hypothetical protein
LLLLPASLPAFTVRTAATDGCHESITRVALAAAPWPVPPPPLSELDRRLAHDLPIDPPGDPLTLALVIGVRHEDLEGVPSTNLSGLAGVHADPAHQAEHCLRAPAQDGAAGDLDAVASCRAALLARLDFALLPGPDLRLDFTTREPVLVAAVFRGSTEVPLLRTPYHLGRALHTLQDSFPHTLRLPGDPSLRAVFNYVDPLSRSYDPARDGPPHQDERDECHDPAGALPAGCAMAARRPPPSALTALALLLFPWVRARSGRRR